MTKSNRNRDQQRNRPRFASRRMANAKCPPSLALSISKVHTFRFRASSASTTDTLTTTSLGNMFVMAATTTTCYQLCSAFRLRRIEIWGPMASDLVPVTVSCQFNGVADQAVGSSRIVTDTSMTASSPAHIVATPSAQTTASLWQGTSTSLTLATLEFPANAVVDIMVEFVIRDESTASSSIAVSGATVGVVYVRRPDVGQLLVPVSYPTI